MASGLHGLTSPFFCLLFLLECDLWVDTFLSPSWHVGAHRGDVYPSLVHDFARPEFIAS